MTQIPPEKARQGRSGKQLLYVLIAALVLTAGVWAAVELYGEGIDQGATGQATDAPAN